MGNVCTRRFSQIVIISIVHYKKKKLLHFIFLLKYTTYKPIDYLIEIAGINQYNQNISGVMKLLNTRTY